MYKYRASDGCWYSIYDHNGNCIAECIFDSIVDNNTRGGGFNIDATMSYIKFSTTTDLYRTMSITVAELISGVTDVVALRSKLDAYCIDELHRQDIVDIYLDKSSGATSTTFHKGAVYLSTTEVDPVSLFGGVWTALVDVFPETIFAWTYAGTSNAVCGTFLCGEAIVGQ